MAAINTVPKSLHLPLKGLSTSATRVQLMCSASVGNDSAVTLQLRDANSTDSINQSSATSPQQQQHQQHQQQQATATPASTLENALTIGYPDPDMLADVLGTIQTASLKNNSNNNNLSTTTNANVVSLATATTTAAASIVINNNKNHIANTTAAAATSTTATTATTTTTNRITITRRNTTNGQQVTRDTVSTAKLNVQQQQTVNTATNTTNNNASNNSSNASNKTNTSYIKNCLIRSSSCSNTATNVATLAQIMSNSSTSSAAALLNNNNSNSNCSSNSNFSSNSSCSNSNSNSNDSSLSLNSNLGHLNFKCNLSNSNSSGQPVGSNSNNVNSLLNGKNVSGLGSTATAPTAKATTSTNAATGTAGAGTSVTTKKHRQKLSSPTRHGPQQCQTCSKIFGNASALAKHKLTHSDERKYICALCSKAFKRQDHLNGHMMTHRNKKPYECKVEGCGKSYCDARSLRRHTENHHAGIVTPQHQSLSPNTSTSTNSSSSSAASTPGSLSLSPATASGDASSPDGATCIRTYISNGGTIVDASTGLALTEEQIKAMNLPIKTGVALLSPTTSTSSTASSSSTCGGSSNSSCSSSGGGGSSSALSISSPTITLTDGATLEGEGLTREQIDLISKIMQQTKQTSAQVTVSSPTSVNSYKINTEAATNLQSRPRTWNMQLLNNASNVSITVDESSAGDLMAASSSPVDMKEDELSQELVAAINPHLLNIVKIEQKPVECNLCHRKFKNVPALNGHMRLHGGYFKKDPETKKAEKKESTGPPLQTASIGVRALIEEKIISKRSKDISKGAFVVPAPPGSVANHTTTTIRRSISDLESFLNPKANSASTTSAVATSTTTALLPASTTIKNANGLSIQQIGLPQSIEIFSSKQQHLKTVNVGTGTNTLTITTNNATTTATATLNSLSALSNVAAASTKNAATDPKDSTLIELLKRGTRIAVTAKKPQQPQLSTNLTQQSGNSDGSSSSSSNISTLPLIASGGRQIITNNNRTVIIPSDVQVVSTKSKLTSSNNANANANNNNNVNTVSSHNVSSNSVVSRATTPASISLADGTPLSLTIASSNDSAAGDVYTVTYASDAAGLFEDAEVYNVSDTEMLLQTVDTMELLNDDIAAQIKSEHSEEFTLVNGPTTMANDGSALSANMIKVESESRNQLAGNNGNSIGSHPLQQQQQQQQQHPQQQQQTTPLPTFQQFHSKEIIMQNSSQIQAITSMGRAHSTLTLPVELKHQLGGVLSSPLHSPLAYPTPPSSHENVAQSSPFVDVDAQHFSDASNSFFGDKCGPDFSSIYFKTSDTDEQQQQQQQQLSDNEKILKLKTVLEESAFDTSIKVEDLLNTNEDGTECDLREFAETNLSFLDDDQSFLNSAHNATSPLSEAFFTSGMSSAEEVKQVLREVLPDESMQLSSGEQQGDNIIDLYYLPGLGLQPQMVTGSEDPLLSSSPREFGQQQQSQQQRQMQQQNDDQLQNAIYAQQLLPQQQAAGYTLPMLGNEGSSQALQYNTLQGLMPAQAQDHFNLNELAGNNGNNGNNGSSSNNSGNCSDLNAMSHQMQQMNNFDGTLLQPLLYANNTTDNSNLLTPQQQQQSMNLLSTADCNMATATTSNGTITNLSMGPTSTMYYSLQASKPAAAAAQPVTASTVISTLQPLSNQTNSILKRRLRPNGSHDSNSSYTKFQPSSPYRSKLRKPSRTHYTPAPILNPDRKGIGLYCSVRKELGQGMLTFDAFDDDFDDHVGLVDFCDESKVNLGSAYQAQIPACRQREDDNGEQLTIDEPVQAELMWNPSVPLDDNTLMRYIDLSKSSAVPLGSHSEEVALQTLLKAEGNTAAAVLTLLQTQSSAFQMKWSAYELEVFLKGLERHGKNFAKIAMELTTKSTGECVQMYYFWKKLCVDYKVSHLKAEPASQPVSEVKPYVCELPDCSASFSSKAALHGHTRIHNFGRNANINNNNNNSNTTHNNNNSQSNSNSATSTTTTTTSTSPTTATATATATTTANNIYACVPNGNNQQQQQQPHQHPQDNNNSNNNTNNTTAVSASASAAAAVNNQKDPNNSIAKEGEFPCKVCGKMFNKVKSRSAHMKTHRVQEAETQQQQQQQQQQQKQQQQATQLSQIQLNAAQIQILSQVTRTAQQTVAVSTTPTMLVAPNAPATTTTTTTENTTTKN